MMNQTFDAEGPADAPALVLIHGSVVTRKMWLPQLLGLSDVFRVIAPDLPGHGALAHIPFSFSTSVDCLVEVIQQEAGGRAMVAGLSLGGYVAIELAHRYPDRVAGLVLSGCSLNFDGLLGGYLKLVSGLMVRGWIKQSRQKAEEKTRRMFPLALANVAEAQLQAGVYPDVLGPSFAEMAGKDFTVPLSTYLGPGLILNGADDKANRRGEFKFVAAMQNGRVAAIPNAGHACNLDQPEAYNQAVHKFGRLIKWIA